MRASDYLPPEPWVEFLNKLRPRFVALYGEYQADSKLAAYFGKSPKWAKRCLEGLDQSNELQAADGYRLSMMQDVLTKTPYTIFDVYTEEQLSEMLPPAVEGWCERCDAIVATLGHRCCWCRRKVATVEDQVA